ncbi:cell division protein FtsA [Viscerimonas tarda]
MEQEEGFIVGINLGTSNIIGLLGRKNEHGVISILASESIPAETCVKHGSVYSINDAAGKVKKLLSLLENKTGKKIGRLYVSLAGRSLKAIEDIQTKKFGTETVITYSLLKDLENQSLANKLPLLSVYDVVSPETYLDGQREEDPIDKKATTVETRYRLIAGRPDIKNNLAKCITEKNKIEIVRYVTGPIATGAVLLGKEDTEAGCVLVDFGGGTTTVSVYKDGLLRNLVVIPFGGKTITKDIQALGFAEDVAESYKIRYGRVGKNKLKSSAEAATDSSINLREFNKVIQARQEEIVENVVNQIKKSEYNGQLDGGIFITGGASQMTGLPEYLAEKTKMKVQIASIKRLYINNATDLLQNPSYSQCLGIMLFAKENCEKVEVQQPKQQPQHHSVNPQSQPNPNPNTDSGKKATAGEEVTATDDEEKVAPDENPITPPKPKGNGGKRKGISIPNLFSGIGGIFKDEE